MDIFVFHRLDSERNYLIQTRSSLRILVSESTPCLVYESVVTLVSESAVLVSESAVDLDGDVSSVVSLWQSHPSMLHDVAWHSTAC